MRKLALTIISTGLFMTSGFAQTLFTYGGNPVSKDEFLRVYQKNALNKKPDFSEKALREYFDLYSLFKMKVKEAEYQKIDTIVNIQRELDNYRRQLARNYLTDDEVKNQLVREAYDRKKEDRHVAHILLIAPPSMGPEDTLKLYQRADSIYTALTKGNADFGKLAAKYSDDRGSKDNGGDIGFITALQTLYPFENAVYGNKPGSVSTPFRTQLGYHIVKVMEARPARGDMQVAQILILTPQSKGEEGVVAAKLKMDTVISAIKKGMSFEDAAKKFSEDQHTSNEGGLMQPFSVGSTVAAFEDAAFALKNPGDISKPVQTEFGIHLIKLVKKMPVKPYDSISTQLKRLVDNDSRAQTARDIFLNKIKEKNGFKEYPENFKEVLKRFEDLPDTGKLALQFKAADFESMNKPIFKLSTTEYTQRDFVAYAEMTTRGRLMGSKTATTLELYKMYVNSVVNDYEENRLMDENADFKNLMQEYRDGIMLFELMDQNVWGKASKDSLGLADYYEANKEKYTWEPGFKGSVYRFKDESSLKAGLKVLEEESATEEDVTNELNTDQSPDAVSVQVGRYEYSRYKDFGKAELIEGKLTSAKRNEDGSYTVVNVEEVFPEATQKELDEARGYVVAEYQDYLEKEWNNMLRSKYPVKLEEPVFKSMLKK